MDHSNYAYIIKDFQPVGLSFDAEASYAVGSSELRAMRIEHENMPNGAVEGIGLTVRQGDMSILLLAGEDFWRATCVEILALLPQLEEPAPPAAVGSER